MPCFIYFSIFTLIDPAVSWCVIEWCSQVTLFVAVPKANTRATTRLVLALLLCIIKLLRFLVRTKRGVITEAVEFATATGTGTYNIRHVMRLSIIVVKRMYPYLHSVFTAAEMKARGSQRKAAVLYEALTSRGRFTTLTIAYISFAIFVYYSYVLER